MLAPTFATHEDRIDGVVITFADITVAKKLEAQLQEKHDSLEKRVAQLLREGGASRRIQKEALNMNHCATGSASIIVNCGFQMFNCSHAQ
ncbi:MAG: hypothetical protein KJ072_02930 [Verrucomicrobia bacterium]|nr:hypothetical protein [Verrucomicrobiota bacterium]